MNKVATENANHIGNAISSNMEAVERIKTYSDMLLNIKGELFGPEPPQITEKETSKAQLGGRMNELSITSHEVLSQLSNLEAAITELKSKLCV